MLIDLHCDTLMKLLDEPAGGDLYKNCWNIDIEKLRKSHYLMQDFAIFVDLEEFADPYRRYEEMKEVFDTQMDTYAEYMRRIHTFEDLEDCRRDGKIGALLSVEEGGVFGGSLEKLEQGFRDGVRLITLTWNYPNELAWPNGTEGADKGLTPRGWEFVEWMQAHGIIADTSHLNDQGTRELLERTEVPVMASHSNAREVFSHPRNLPDDLLRLFGEKGGIIGLNFSRNFVGSEPITAPDQINNPRMIFAPVTEAEYHAIATGKKPHPPVDLREPLRVSKAADIAKHAKYMANLAGVETIALGTDFDGIQPFLEIHDAGEMEKLLQALKDVGFTAHEIDLICEKNAWRFLAETLPRR
ncbi:MAG: membrane dipeptidase [Veillonellaceae bacterium]|nr:membrane dipeptidase [Veillonellaceae bacterium]